MIDNQCSVIPILTFQPSPGSKSLETSWLSSSFIRDGFPVHLQIAAAFQTTHLLLEPWFRFLIRRPADKGGERRGWRRGIGKRKDPYRMLSTGQWIFPHHSNVSCLSDSLQQILKCDNGPQKWVMVSFCWFHFPDPPYPPGLCTSIN